MPAPAKLAAFASGFDLQGHDFRKHATHWHKEYEAADSNDMLRFKIAEAMLSMCVITVNGQVTKALIEASSAHVPQRHRQHMLSLMGLSALAQHVLTPEMNLHDAEALGEANLLFDMFVNDGPYRFHFMSPETTPTPEVGNWYRHGNLYLREMRPAEPSTSLKIYLNQQGVTADFPQATTLYPFLASREGLAESPA